jgi:hypothetical protein
MSKKTIAVIFFGLVLMLLGLLWLLQGSDIIHLRPIFCVANCEPITGHSPLWQIIGAIAFVVGILIIGANVRNIKREN